MTKREKRLQKLRRNPKDVSFDTLRQVIEDYGFRLDSTAGSHHTFRVEVEGRVWKLTIPLNKPVKIVYVKQSLNAIDEIRNVLAAKAAEEEQEADDDTDEH